MAAPNPAGPQNSVPLSNAVPTNVGPDVSPAWPPTLDTRNTTTLAPDGRTIERFIHGPRDTWGYQPDPEVRWDYPVAQETGVAQQNINSFYVVSPKVPRPNAPLFVVLHSANRTAYDYLSFGVLGKTEGGQALVMTKAPEDFYILFLNCTNHEWWGGNQTHRNGKEVDPNHGPTCGEKRALDTIEWVANKYGVDRNRIYLAGLSMGGCGTLGIGMPNGNIFAAIRACVPAGTSYASYRLGGFGPSPDVGATDADRAAWVLRASGVGLPDPPVICDFSSHIDSWSTTQPALVNAAHAGHLPLVLCWGRFGHTTWAEAVMKFPICNVALAFPWTEIRKNEAYPVFTNASCDQRVPWLNAPVDYDDAGVTNAFFRWKSEKDTATDFSMQLWIEHPTVPDPQPSMPRNATADVTPRRLQQFKVEPSKSYIWQVSDGGKILASGKVTPDAANLLTIPKVPIAMTPVDLSLKADGP